MELAIDASSLINLARAGALGVIFSLPDCQFIVSPLVAGECDGDCMAEIVALSAVHPVTFIAEDEISAEAYIDLLATHELGEGETESIAVCLAGDCALCCDDRKARRVATDLLGAERVTGSLGLLKKAVQAGLITAPEAWALYLAMKEAGGFLPEVDPEWFS